MSKDAGNSLGRFRFVESILDGSWHALLGRLVEVISTIPKLARCGKELVVPTSNGSALGQVFQRPWRQGIVAGTGCIGRHMDSALFGLFEKLFDCVGRLAKHRRGPALGALADPTQNPAEVGGGNIHEHLALALAE
jgi:hypothetical protein